MKTTDFFVKYDIKLDEWNALDHIYKAAKKAKKCYSAKNEDKYLRKLAHVHDMIEDFFEVKELTMADYKK